MSERMPRRDRDDLARLVRRQEKLAKEAVGQRAAELQAEFEQRMATVFSWDSDDVWREAKQALDAAYREANERVAERCAELGIPKEFRPGLSPSYWYGRRENATASRRDELRRVAKTRIAAIEKAARLEVERWSVETQRALVAGGLESDEARAFLESVPSLESLMPAFRVPELERYVGTSAASFEELEGRDGLEGLEGW